VKLLKEKHLYSFGEFSLNVEDHTLSRNGDNVPITPKMFDLLLVLLQNPQRVLRKEFLLQSVWPDSFVEEGNITFNIGQLRKAMNDDAQSPSYIETVPRRGYRFLMPVESFTTVTPDKEEEVIGAERADGAERVEPVSARNSRPFVLIALSAGVLVLGAFLIAGWLIRKQSSTTPILSKPFSLEKLSTDGGVYHVAISPDGKNIVYTHEVVGKQSLWLRQLETSTNVPIVPPSYDFFGGLTFAPDGSTIYFVRGTREDPQLTIYRMPIFGGVPQKVTAVTQGWISISSDGKMISYVRCPYTDEDYCSLYVADALDGQNEKKLVTRPRPFRIGDSKFSRDGKTLAFATGQSRTSSNEFTLSAVDMETGVQRDLTPEKFFNIGYIESLPDSGEWLITALQLPGTSQIWHILANGEAQKLTSDSETYGRLSMDRAGDLVVSTQVEPDFRLGVYQTQNPAVPSNILGNANTVAFGQDGRIYFASNRTGNFELWTGDPGGTDVRQLTNDPSNDSVPFLSRDGKTIFFDSDRTGVLQIWRMNLDGTDQRQVTTQEGGLPVRISPDGAWLYYTSSLRNTLRRVLLENGQEELVLKSMGRGLVVSPDLTRVAYSQRRGQETVVILASLPYGDTLKTWKLAGAPNLAHLLWPVEGNYLVYVATDEPRKIGGIWFQPLDSDKPELVADLGGEEIAEYAAFAMSDDAKQFAMIKGNWKHDAVLLRGLK
jgi:Tol biopolymer transport system component/DNA-binding winged helix-turn-helix (wHTH) protein